MSGLSPDIAGFADAQKRLRAQFGRDIRFYAPAQIIYDSGLTPFEFDEEGMPLDPLASATVIASAGVELANLTVVGSAHCNVVFRPLQTSIMRRDETFETPLAMRSGINRDLIMDIEQAPIASGATHYMVGTLARDAAGSIIYPEQWKPDDGELWKIVNAKTDGIGGLQRFIVYGEGTR